MIHNPRVIASRFRRPLTATLAMAATVVVALLPPAHIHLGADHDDHDHTAGIEHSHWSAHQGSTSAFDDDDGRVLFVNHSALVRATHGHGHRPDVAVIARLNATSAPVVAFTSQRVAGNAPRDGPALDLPTLRGPPFVL